MDRKNKKAAQQAAAASSGGNRKGGGNNKRDAGSKDQGAKNSLLAGGSTAPTRVRPPMNLPLKATISPSAPAPPLNDTDFEMEGVGGAPQEEPQAPAENTPSPPPLPVSAPRNPPSASAAQTDFGPIGSPPNARAASPSTSPRPPNGLTEPTSPFNATTFQGAASYGTGLAMLGGKKGWGDYAGISNSVQNDYDDLSRNPRRIPLRGSAVVDDEMEDFIPGSLTDLLTPEERSRRMSRSNSGQPPVGLTAFATTLKNAEGTEGSSIGHRHSRSVPAPSLLGDLKSIWAEPSGLPASPGHLQTHHRGTPSQSGLTARLEGLSVHDDGLSMSFGSPSNINSMLSPTNASAAFLPGFHSHYAKAKQQAALGQGTSALTRGLRNLSNPLQPPPATSTAATNSLANNYLGSISNAGLPASASNASTLHTHIHGNTAHTYRTTPSPFDLTQNLVRPVQRANGVNGVYGGGSVGAGAGLGVGLSGGLEAQADMLLGVPNVLSPSTTRALQSHAPGQSLPQGLAAGLSRIHALPPLPNIVSPAQSSFTGAASPAANAGLLSTNAAYGQEWGSFSSTSLLSQQHQQQLQSLREQQQQEMLQAREQELLQQQQPHRPGAVQAPPGLPSLPEKMSYSAIAATPRGASVHNANPLVPPGVTRSNLNVPATAGGFRSAHDDDELFSMDG